MTFLELYDEGLDRELASKDQAELFTTERRKDAINQAQLQFAKDTGCFVKSASLTLVDDQREYDLATVIASADFYGFAKDGVEYVFTDASANVSYHSGDDFPRRDLDWLNRQHPGWRMASSTTFPQSWYLRDAGGSTFIGFSEPPAIETGESASLTVPYLAIPPDMSADTDEPFSDSAGTNPLIRLRPWHRALIHFAAAVLEPLRKNYAAEQRQRAIYQGLVGDYLAHQSPRGGQTIQLARSYYREARRRPAIGPLADPRVFP